MAAAKRGPQPALSCNITWCAAVPASSAGRDGKRVVLPLRQSWTAACASQADSTNSTPVDVHLYVRGGTWIEQFAGKLVGEVGGHRHLSSIYVTGELRAQGEAEFKARLESKGWTLPSGFQCNEWVLYQRQGDKIIIKLGYAKHAALDGITVFLEAPLNDGNVWWSLPVLVDTGNEPVYGKQVIAGIYSPAIEGQEIAIGIANRGVDNVAVMPFIDGRNLLKAPYFLWAGDAKKREWEIGGSTFVTFPGLQTTMQRSKREKTEVTYKTLKFQKTTTHDGPALAPDTDQGKLKVFVYRTRKVVLKSDPDRAWDQLDQLRKSIFSASAARGVGPLRLQADSQDLPHFDQHVVSTADEARQVLTAMEASCEAQAQIGEVVINYRSLAWFREAAAAKHRATPAPSPSPRPVSLEASPSPTASSSPPSTPPAGFHGKSTRNGSSPDSIAPLVYRETMSSRRRKPVYDEKDADSESSLEKGQNTLPPQKSKSFQPESKKPEQHSPQKAKSPSTDAVTIANKGDTGNGKISQKPARDPGLFDRLSQPKVSKVSPLTNEPFATSLRSSSRSRDRPPAPDNLKREKSESRTPSRPRLRDRSPSPSPSPPVPRPRESFSSPGTDKPRLRDRSPAGAPRLPAGDAKLPAVASGSLARAPRPHLRDRSPAPPPARVREKSPSPGGSFSTRDKSPAPSPSQESRGRGMRQGVEREGAEGGHLAREKLRERRSASREGKSSKDPNPEAKPVEETVIWILPRIQGREEALQKDEIVLRSAVRNIANLRRQVKQDLSPLLDEWSTAELVVMAGETLLEPETLLDGLPTGTGSPSNPILVTAPERTPEKSPEKGEKPGFTVKPVTAHQGGVVSDAPAVAASSRNAGEGETDPQAQEAAHC